MHKLDKEEYPQEHYLPLENNPHYLGRVVINKLKKSFFVEVDIIHQESHKIFHHVDSIFDLDEEQDALFTAVQSLANFLQKKGAHKREPL
ncbi:MAG: hypothetical protein JNM93_01835 [Bacteriovoracaceae bacterium]|nr:hypothetical protein [Bacteriovoracaceae bacterium]